MKACVCGAPCGAGRVRRSCRLWLCPTGASRNARTCWRCWPICSAVVRFWTRRSKPPPRLVRWWVACASSAGWGPVVGLAYELTILDPTRFQTSRQVASYLGLIPAEHSSGGKQRLGHISKQGNALLRGLLVEAAHVAVRWDPEWRRQYVRLAMKKNRSIAAVAMARKLAVRLWWLWKSGLASGQIGGSGSHAEQPV